MSKEIKISVRGLKPHQKEKITELINQVPTSIKDERKRKLMEQVIKMLQNAYKTQNLYEKADDDTQSTFKDYFENPADKLSTVAGIIAEFNNLKKMK